MVNKNKGRERKKPLDMEEWRKRELTAKKELEDRIKRTGRKYLEQTDTKLSIYLINDVIKQVVLPYVDNEEDWRDMTMLALVKSTWNKGDLHSLWKPGRSDVTIFNLIPSFHDYIKLRSGPQGVSTEYLAHLLSLQNSTVKIQIVQELHGFQSSFDWYWSISPEKIYLNMPFRRELSLKELLARGEKLPTNDEDKKRLEGIKTIDKTRDFDWKTNNCHDKDIHEDPRGYRYKYSDNIYTFTCLFACPYQWNFLLLATTNPVSLLGR